MAHYGRNRQSINDIEEVLNDIFLKHPNCRMNEAGQPSVPGTNIFDILKSFSELYNGTPLLSDEEEAQLQTLVDMHEHEGIEVSTPLLLQLVAEKTKAPTSPSPPPKSPRRDSDSRSSGDEYEYSRSRTSSNESTDASYRSGSFSRPPSRPPSRGPETPSLKSPLDSQRRQRSTPLNAPSSWAKRPAPASRRKSDAGQRSDSEGGPPTVWGRNHTSRARTPSNPTSPTTPNRELSFSPGSPDFPKSRSRPHSRAQSQPQNNFLHGTFDMGYSSPDDTVTNPRSRFNGLDSFESQISTLPMPRSGDDSDEEDEILGLVHDRSVANSTVSMEVHERLEALQRVNEELTKKKLDAELTLQNKLAEHELELEETHQRLEELRSELAASNREEKELRAKDSRNMAQITALEAEIAKVQRALDSAKTTYVSLQRQYQEQCTVSEKYRDDLRAREETIRSLREAVALHEIETGKWVKEHESYEERIVQLEHELSIALEAHTQLDEQKQENMLLKETIDRMRFDMDELRNAMTTNIAGGSGQASAANSISKSLGAELQGQMNWSMDEEEAHEGNSEDGTVVEEEEVTEEEDEEDVVQTIITKRKRKVASRANKELESMRKSFEEVKEYSDSGCQYDPTLFAVNHGMQTDAEPKLIMRSFEIQTEEIPQPKLKPVSPPRIMAEIDIQTEAVEEPSRSSSPSPAQVESMASSSSTIVPPTPKPTAKHLELDEPPAYNQVEADKKEEELTLRTLRKFHPGINLPAEGIPGGIPEEAVAEWKALKQELGVECSVIDKVIEASEKIPAVSSSRPPQKSAKTSKFFNVYNTYVYGDKSSGYVTPALLMVATALVTVVLTSANSSAPIVIPGGATPYDRAAWASFNAMPGAGEGYTADGTAALWEIMGRVGGTAARLARGWPT